MANPVIIASLISAAASLLGPKGGGQKASGPELAQEAGQSQFMAQGGNPYQQLPEPSTQPQGLFPAQQVTDPVEVGKLEEPAKPQQLKLEVPGEDGKAKGSVTFKDTMMSPEVISALMSVAMQPRQRRPVPSAPGISSPDTRSQFSGGSQNPYEVLQAMTNARR